MLNAFTLPFQQVIFTPKILCVHFRELNSYTTNFGPLSTTASKLFCYQIVRDLGLFDSIIFLIQSNKSLIFDRYYQFNYRLLLPYLAVHLLI